MAIARIQGPMLVADLLRHGIDFAVETDLLYFDVGNDRIGINNAGPAQALDVSGGATVDNISITTNTISSLDTDGDINLTPDGVGNVILGNYEFDADQTVGAGQDDFVLTYNDSTGLITLEPGGSSGGTIGAAEDGDYTDGLFIDFVPSTPVGTPIDRFNEVLKALAPAPAPLLEQVESDDSGPNSKLSWGTSNAIGGYTNVDNTAGNGVVDLNGAYNFISSSTRLGAFDGTDIINGVLNDDVVAKGLNYPDNAFGPGDSGTLSIEVNGVEEHSVDLSVFGSGLTETGGTGFNVIASTDTQFEDTTPFPTFQYRTGTWHVAIADQNDGFNYVQIKHDGNVTNYIEWVNDSEATALSAATGVLDTLVMTGTKNLSGVIYDTGGTALYDVTISNLHRNLYSSSASAMSYTETSCSVPNTALANIVDETETEVITNVVATISSGIRLLDASIAVGVNVDHPLKSNLSNQQSQSISGILMDNVNTANTVIVENFCLEDNRLPSVAASVNDYDLQADITSATWTSTESLVGATAGFIDGLLMYNGSIRYPTEGVNSGDFRSTGDGGSITNGPSSNVDYSAASGDRYFYRKFQNNSGTSRSNFRINITGTGTTFATTATGATTVAVELKFPPETGWLDAYADFATDQWGDGDGARNATDGAGRALATNWGLTVGTKSIANNEWIVIFITATSSYTGNIDGITLTWL